MLKAAHVVIEPLFVCVERMGAVFLHQKAMLIHGVFFLSCFLMPMTGMFTSMANGEKGNGGDIALLFWCAYFLPIGVLAWKHFSNGKD